MVKTLMALSNSGVKDWLIQRISAVLILTYTASMGVFFITHHPLSYSKWHALYSCHFVKITSLLVLLSVVLHAWIGIWTVLTDYVKGWLVRLFMQVTVLLFLAYCFLWGVDIVWSVV